MVEGVRVRRREADTATTATVSRDRQAREQGPQQRLGNRVVQRMLKRPDDGLPEPLRAGVEALSGLSMDAVRVHRDSPRPARMKALAFAHGADIHLGPGQERHLPHEAWHVVQQAQGRAMTGDRGLEREADSMGERAARGATQAPRSLAPMRVVTPVLQAKTVEEIARHGSFDIEGATYRLHARQGCEIGIRFKLGTGVPADTTISFIQALRTTTRHLDDSVTSAQVVPGQTATDDHSRIDQFEGNPSAFYLDHMDERLVALLVLARRPVDERPYDIRDFRAYEENSMGGVTEAVFDDFWDKYDNHRLRDLIGVQTETGTENETMSQGQSMPPSNIWNLFNLFNSNIDARIYDMPRGNLRPPTEIGEVSTCLFHTAAVTKVNNGDATVWDVIQWGYTITKTGEAAYDWALLPLRPVAFNEAMIGPALARMRETTPDFIGPTGLVAAG